MSDMKHISALKDMGTGKSCILIGNGPSAQMLETMKLPGGIWKVGMNKTPLKCDMLVYYDADVAAHFDGMKEPPADMVIGMRSRNQKVDNTSRHCTHYYNEVDMMMGDTGFHALQFADKIFNFNTIYLTGYDYIVKGKTYHFYEKESKLEAIERFKIWSIGTVLERYKLIDWKNDIYNLNVSSALKAFPYKKI